MGLFGGHSPTSSGGGLFGTGGGGSMPTPKPAKHSGGGGVLGALGSAGHWVGQKAGLAARDIKGIPGGMYAVAQPVVHLEKGLYFTATGNTKAAQKEQAIRDRETSQLLHGQWQSVKQAVEHPLRDPFATAATVLPALGGLAKAGDVASGGRLAGEATAPRVLKSGGAEVPLIRSNSTLGRIGQNAYDSVLQRGLNKNEAGQATGPVSRRVAAHAQKRIGGAHNEIGNIQTKMANTPATMLDNAAAKLSKVPARRREQQAALELTSNQTMPADAAAYHEAQAAKGVNPKQNLAVAKLYRRVAARNLVHLDETQPAGQKVSINPAHLAAAKADQALQQVAAKGDQHLAQYGVRSPEALQQRINEPGQVRAGGSYVKPTPARNGAPSQALIRQRAQVDRMQTLFDRATAPEATSPGQPPNVQTRIAASPTTERLGGALSVAKDRLQQMEAAAQRRVEPTGIVGGETARPGRNYVSEQISQKKLGKTEVSSSPGPVVGKAASPISAKSYTGRAMEQGLRPANVTGSASRHFRLITKFVNTDMRRRAALETGSDVRRSARDILVRQPDETAKPLGPQMLQAVGKETSAVDSADQLASHDQATAEGLRAAHEMFRQHILDKADESAAAQIGAKAQAGYRWVDKNALGDLTATPRGPSGKLGRGVDTVNSAITAATVYFKVGHIGTRVLTNAATNMMQGSLGPRQIGRSARMWEGLSDGEKARALAAAGQHGFSALPHEGANLVGRGATKGAGFWAKHADAPFRFNSLRYELAKIGVDSPAKFRRALDGLESGGQGMPAGEWARLSGAARKADREAISYDRLGPFEKRFLTRAVWFYPWVKGATLFTVRSMLEHPYKMGALGLAGVEGRKRQLATLGPTPSYEAGLIGLGGGSHPLTTDLSTFTPFSTAGDVLDSFVNPGGLAGQLNPAVGAGGRLAYGLNQYGASSKSPYLDALQSVAASTPEQQMLQGYQQQGGNQQTHMFHKSLLGSLVRYLGGPATPRQVNRAALAKAAQRERSGRR